MTWEAWITLATLGGMVIAMARHWAGPDVIMVGALIFLMTLGLFTPHLPSPAEIVAGFGNPGVITVAVLFVVAAGMTETGGMQRLAGPLLGRPRGEGMARARLMLPITTLSAFLNNTPIVAMFLPVVSDWARKHHLSPSKLMIPLSYAAILGGMCTLIGTSTNLIVNGLLIADSPGHRSLGMFEISLVGIPCAVVGVIYLIIAGHWLLPDRQPAFSEMDDPRQYTVEMLVDPGSPLAGKTIEQAGLRQLPGLYLAQIDREGELIQAVEPTRTLLANDRLVFVGVVESVVDLRKMRGLSPAENQHAKIHAAPAQRTLIEAVVSDTCPLVGKTIREGRFRTVYNAAVIAVARNGERIAKKIGDITLRPGDTLLLEATPAFVRRQRDRRDFFLVSAIAGSTPPRHDRAVLASAILLAMVLLVALTPLSMLNGALLAAGAMVLTRCCTATAARRAIDWQVLIAIGAALGIAAAVEKSGAAVMVAHAVLTAVGRHPYLALLAIYVITNVCTELVGHAAAAVLLFPIAKATAATLSVSFMPFVIVIMIAASASFATPIGYQTNLMVFGPGGYRYGDYLRIGLPLNVLMCVVTVGLVPVFWPLGG